MGFWQGATENHVICQELLADLEARKLELNEDVVFITDGGKGVIKALKDRFGKRLIHQRCTVHNLSFGFISYENQKNFGGDFTFFSEAHSQKHYERGGKCKISPKDFDYQGNKPETQVHKDRNIQRHLAKKYRGAAHQYFRNAINCHKYENAKEELKKLGK